MGFRYLGLWLEFVLVLGLGVSVKVGVRVRVRVKVTDALGTKRLGTIRFGYELSLEAVSTMAEFWRNRSLLEAA